MSAFRRLLTSTTALGLISVSASVHVLTTSPALAACVLSGATTTCTSAAPNPWTATIGTGRDPANDNQTVIIESGATVSTADANAISLHDGAAITVRDGGTVTNQTVWDGPGGLYNTGLNTIEVNSNSTIIIERGGSVIKTGDQMNAEAINVHGSGNRITNYGLISAEWSAALWFQDETTGVANVVDNYGVITRVEGGALIGTGSFSPDTGIVMINRPDALLHGDLTFGYGDDQLHIWAGSTIDGAIDGGDGRNRVFLNGDAGTSDQLAGHLPNFQELIKEGAGQWTITGPLAGYETTTVRAGVLTLTGDNSNYLGETLVESAGVLEGRAQNLPVRADAAANIANIRNDGVVRFTQPGGDDATYAGQIIGAGAVEKTGDGVVTLAPQAGANTFSGGLLIRQGMIAASADAVLGAPDGAITLDGGALRFADSFTLAPARAVSVTANNGGVDVAAGVTGVITQGITGAGGLTKTGDGALLLTGVSSYSGPTSVAAGVLAVGDADHRGAAIGPGQVNIAQGATLGGYGAVTGDVANQGVLAVANAMAAFSDGPGGNFSVGGQLVNAGLVQIGGGGQVGNTLTVGSYHGAGGAIALNTYLGGDGSPSDRLIINGGVATGSTPLLITNVGGPGAATPGNGIQVVSAINGATTAANAFDTPQPLLVGPYRYTLHRGTRDASDPESWYLRTDDDASRGGGGGTPGAPVYRRETALYAALPSMALLYGQTMLGTLHERVGEQELQRGFPASAGGSPIANAVWGRVIGSHGRVAGDRSYAGGPGFAWDFYAFQIGMDLYRKQHADGSRDHLGFYIGAGRADGDVKHYAGGRAGDMRFDAYTVGAYWTHYGATGWYVDAVAQGTWYNAKAASGRIATFNTDGFGAAFSLEGGYPFQLGDGWVLEPQAQIILQKINLDSGHDDAAFVKFTRVNSVAARIGARLSRSWIIDSSNGPIGMNAWVRADLWNEFAGTPRANFSSDLGYTPFRSDMKGAWADISAGVTAQFNANAALYASASYQTSFDGRRHGWSGKAGLRITW